MQLQLRYEPTPENAPKFAENIVAAAENISEVALDYSVESLQAVDDIIESFRQDGCTAEQVAATLFGFGCYIGEVFVRHAGGAWKETAQTEMATIARFPMVVALENGKLCNPIGKAFKRLQNGEEDNIPYFYQVFAVEE